MRVSASLKTRPLGSSHRASRCLTCSACAREDTRRAHHRRTSPGPGCPARRARCRLPVPDPGRLFHAVQCHVHQARADHPALRSSSPDGANRPSSITPAFSYRRTSPRAGKDPSEPRMCSWLSRSNAASGSASNTHRRLASLRPPWWDGHDRVMAATAGPEAVGLRLEPGLPLRFQRAQPGPEAPCRRSREFRADDGARCSSAHTPAGQAGATTRQPRAAPIPPYRLSPGQQDHPPVHPSRPAASVDLRHPPHAHQSAAAGPEHQLLQVTDPGKVPGLRCREDPPSQPPYVFFGLAPVHSVPVQAIVLRSVHQIGVQLVPWFGRPDVILSPQAHQTRVSALSSRAAALSGQLCGNRWRRSQHLVPVSCCLSATGIRFSDLPAPALGFCFSSRSAYRQKRLPDPIGVVTFRMR